MELSSSETSNMKQQLTESTALGGIQAVLASNNSTQHHVYLFKFSLLYF